MDLVVGHEFGDDLLHVCVYCNSGCLQAVFVKTSYGFAGSQQREIDIFLDPNWRYLLQWTKAYEPQPGGLKLKFSTSYIDFSKGEFCAIRRL